jgi:hypothetical protein
MLQIFRILGFQVFRNSDFLRMHPSGHLGLGGEGVRAGGRAAGGLRLGPRVAAWAFSAGGQATGYGSVTRVVMETSGGTSLCSQSSKHFRELCWVGDCLIIEESQPDFLRQGDGRFQRTNWRYRPLPDRRGNYPISIVKASFDPVDCPVFGKQIDIITESPQPHCEIQVF